MRVEQQQRMKQKEKRQRERVRGWMHHSGDVLFVMYGGWGCREEGGGGENTERVCGFKCAPGDRRIKKGEEKNAIRLIAK